MSKDNKSSMSDNKREFECPKCESSNIITRVTGTRYCRRCGHVWEVESKKKSS